ncbi:tail fiber domain-containing protein [uncultured Imperialibacter sp.]|uniref:tail fiber domain-containing protein n=1 Tax=uncultured Imperialibacter sp. TaxID=1672639 RepID=UPI0030DA74D6|tara:strand:- start:44034 stop:45014 length:981 start_codon:yes stop_codon:yes gene_type:complete
MKKPLQLASTIIFLFFNQSFGQIYTDEVQVVEGLGGKVGIGRSTPGAILDVFGSSADASALRISQSNQNTANGVTGALATAGAEMQSIEFYYSGAAPNSVVGKIALVNHNTEGTGWYGIDYRYDAGLSFFTSNGNTLIERLTIKHNGNVGIGLANPSETLSVNGNASKSSAGDWVANSDARLKKKITQLSAPETLDKLLQLKGVTYEWADDKTGINRPIGIQYGFTAQNIQEVFPELVEEDNLGYLQTAYGTYDAMLIEALRALNEKIERLEVENETLRATALELKKSDDQQQLSIASLQKQIQELAAIITSTQPREGITLKTSEK